jgi:hypothetical protein
VRSITWYPAFVHILKIHPDATYEVSGSAPEPQAQGQENPDDSHLAQELACGAICHLAAHLAAHLLTCSSRVPQASEVAVHCHTRIGLQPEPLPRSSSQAVSLRLLAAVFLTVAACGCGSHRGCLRL